MSHLSTEQLLDAYYDGADPEAQEHLQQCSQCAGQYNSLEEWLHTIRDMPVPKLPANFEQCVWARLVPELPQKTTWFGFPRLLLYVPAFMALLLIAFVAGILTQRQQHLNVISPQASERVLSIALNDHLERSQILLTEFLTASPKTLDLMYERSRARELLEQNRLLRQVSARAGQTIRIDTLEDLERTLLDLANSSVDSSAKDIQDLQARVKSDGLLFKVRVINADMRHEGQI